MKATEKNNLWDISKHGDWLELEASEFIRVNIPAYEEIWKRYIGNNGNGRIAEIKKITPELDYQRRDFSQYHYTILESLYFMNHILSSNKYKVVDSFEIYMGLLNHLMVYQTYAGRIRDNIEEIFTVLNKPLKFDSIKSRLSKFYEERHVFVHRKKVPFSVDSERLFKIAQPQSNENKNVGFGKKMLWEEITPNELKYVDDYLNNSFRELVQEVNNILALILSEVREIIKNNNLEIESPPIDSLLNRTLKVQITNASGVGCSYILFNTSGSIE